MLCCKLLKQNKQGGLDVFCFFSVSWKRSGGKKFGREQPGTVSVPCLFKEGEFNNNSKFVHSRRRTLL